MKLLAATLFALVLLRAGSGRVLTRMASAAAFRNHDQATYGSVIGKMNANTNLINSC